MSLGLRGPVPVGPVPGNEPGVPSGYQTPAFVPNGGAGSAPPFLGPTAQSGSVPLTVERLNRAVPDLPGAGPVAARVEETDAVTLDDGGGVAIAPGVEEVHPPPGPDAARPGPVAADIEEVVPATLDESAPFPQPLRSPAAFAVSAIAEMPSPPTVEAHRAPGRFGLHPRVEGFVAPGASGVSPRANGWGGLPDDVDG